MLASQVNDKPIRMRTMESFFEEKLKQATSNSREKTKWRENVLLKALVSINKNKNECK